MKVSSPEALQLFHEGMVALADVESAGVRVDMGRVLSTEREIAAKVADVKAGMRESDVFKAVRRRYGDRANVMAYEQVATVLFKDMGFTPTEFTASSYDQGGNLRADAKPSARRSSLEKVDHPFVKDFDYAHKLEKTLGTYVTPLKYHAVEHGRDHWRVHPFYNLTSSIGDDDSGGAMSYRSSCDSPNYQNQPVRDPETAEFVRSLYLPSPGDYHFGEPDYGQIEVRMAAVVTKDPALMKEVTDPTTDMHRDTAAQAFMVSVDWMNRHAKDVKKTLRDSAKNQIVFPMFYGSTYFNCAPLIWERMLKQRWKIPGTDQLMIDHLRKKGVTELGACRMGVEPVKGTFEYQIRKVENFLWERFRVYKEWKFEYYKQYLRDGGFRMATGFWVWQHLSRRQVTNAPIQGIGFHCLLKALILLHKWLKKYKMRTKIIGQIHDSMQQDVHRKELQDVMAKTHKVMSVEVPKLWPWITVPLPIEWEASPLGESWARKKVYEPNDGTWEPKG